MKSRFKDNKIFETKDIASFYKEFDANIKNATINWRVHTLIQMGIIHRVERSKFIFGEGRFYIPLISDLMKSLYNKIKKEFPYIKIAIWHTSALNEFMIHQPGLFYLIIEVDKEAAQAVFYFLKESKYAVFIEPTIDILEKYVPNNKEALIIKPLVSESPIQTIQGIDTPVLEKILVDIFCDDVVFVAQQGAEMTTIFNEVFKKYSINNGKMLRYAKRRGKKDSFSQYLKKITN